MIATLFAALALAAPNSDQPIPHSNNHSDRPCLMLVNGKPEICHRFTRVICPSATCTFFNSLHPQHRKPRPV